MDACLFDLGRKNQRSDYALPSLFESRSSLPDDWGRFSTTYTCVVYRLTPTLLFLPPTACCNECLFSLSHSVSVEQKWSKGKVRDKLANLSLFDKPTYDKLLKEVPSWKLITPAVVSERLRIKVCMCCACLPVRVCECV